MDVSSVPNTKLDEEMAVLTLERGGFSPGVAPISIIGKYVKKLIMWSLLFGVLSLFFYLGLNFVFGASSPKSISTDPHNRNLRENLSAPYTHTDSLENDWEIVDRPQSSTKFDNFLATVRLPTRLVGYLEQLPKVFSRREISLSTRVSLAITVFSVVVIMGCTGLAIHAGISKNVLLDLNLLQKAEEYCMYAAYITLTMFLLSALLALVALPENIHIQTVCAVIALLTIMAVTGAMIAQLLYRAQNSAIPEKTTDPSSYGSWLTHFGLGGVMAFSTGAFGCSMVMGCVEMILFKTKGKLQEPILTSVALPSAVLYNIGNTHMSYFQKLIRLALLIRFALYIFTRIYPNWSFL